MKIHIYYVYILTTKFNKLVYIGVTNNIVRRLSEHKSQTNDCFTKKYNIDKLVYFEIFDYIDLAIAREKELKKFNREKKNRLIEAYNPQWLELDPTKRLK